jgi:type I restriction enzyme S subunit
VTGWRVVRVGDISEQVRGVTYPKTEASSSPSAGRIALLRAGNITEHGLSFNDLLYVPESRANQKQRLRRGDVVIAASSGSLDVVGKAAQVEDDSVATFGAFCKVLRPSPQIDPRYFMHYFRTDSYRRHISRLAAGININNLRNQDLDDLDIPLPPPSEQRRIAAILDHADALRAKRREAVAGADELTKSIFVDMFGIADPEWPEETIENIAAPEKGSIRTGPFGSQLLHEEFTDAGIAVLGIDNAVSNRFDWGKLRFISERKYQQLKRYTVHPGDVLITIMGTNGRCAIVPDDVPLAINTKHLCCITVDRNVVYPEFVHTYFLQHPTARQYLRRTAKGAIMAGLNMGIIKSMPIRVPPLRLQQDFVAKLKALAEHRTQLEAGTQVLDKLFASLQFQAFRGGL